MFYHRTTEEAWRKIQQEGVLWGIGSYGDRHRYTYLSPDDWGESYGTVLLKVRYIPCGRKIDNYCFGRPFGTICTQFSVFVPIPLCMVERVERVVKKCKSKKKWKDWRTARFLDTGEIEACGKLPLPEGL